MKPRKKSSKSWKHGFWSIQKSELLNTVGQTKNATTWKCHIFLKNDPISIIFLVKIRTDYKFFFAHIFKSIGPILKKLRAKTYFCTFSKMLKNTPMTWKIYFLKHWHYEFFSFFGFGFKHSIAIFSAIQHVIWSRIDDFRTFWKLPDFPFLTCFLT